MGAESSAIKIFQPFFFFAASAASLFAARCAVGVLLPSLFLSRAPAAVGVTAAEPRPEATFRMDISILCNNCSSVSICIVDILFSSLSLSLLCSCTSSFESAGSKGSGEPV